MYKYAYRWHGDNVKVIPNEMNLNFVEPTLITKVLIKFREISRTDLNDNSTVENFVKNDKYFLEQALIKGAGFFIDISTL